MEHIAKRIVAKEAQEPVIKATTARKVRNPRGSGRKTRKEEIKDHELHKKASTWLFTNFHKFPDDKKLDLAIKLLAKFGTSTLKQEVNVRNLTDDERQSYATLLRGLQHSNN